MKKEAKTYVRGLGLILALILLGIVGFIALGFITIGIFIVLGILFIGIAVLALLLTPYYFAKDYKIKSKNFRLKKVKKKEKL